MREVETAFKNLPKTTRNKALRPALRDGAAIVRNAAKANIRSNVGNDSTGTLEKNVIARSFKNKNGNLRAGVQIKKGAVYSNKKDSKGSVRVGLVGAVLEYRDGGKYSWLRKAARENIQKVFVAVRERIDSRMAQAVKDARK